MHPSQIDKFDYALIRDRGIKLWKKITTPLIEDILPDLSKAHNVSLVDTGDGFWHVVMDEQSNHRTILNALGEVHIVDNVIWNINCSWEVPETQGRIVGRTWWHETFSWWHIDIWMWRQWQGGSRSGLGSWKPCSRDILRETLI